MGSGQPGPGRLTAPASSQAPSSAGDGLTVPPCQLSPLVSASCERQPWPTPRPLLTLLDAGPSVGLCPAAPPSPPWAGRSARALHRPAGRRRWQLQSRSPSSSRWGGQQGYPPHRHQPGAPSARDGQQGPGREVTLGPVLPLRGSQAPVLEVSRRSSHRPANLGFWEGVGHRPLLRAHRLRGGQGTSRARWPCLLPAPTDLSPPAPSWPLGLWSSLPGGPGSGAGLNGLGDGQSHPVWQISRARDGCRFRPSYRAS